MVAVRSRGVGNQQVASSISHAGTSIERHGLDDYIRSVALADGARLVAIVEGIVVFEMSDRGSGSDSGS
ncbi:hypothetical protein HTZ84_11010 [Haloterrigena sp. SYSU A558-1]|uniref:Uncharacterized protein n=1 Tax=Haloterrigena gelatinilytica TaxID=2741724 RepID=A0A8J8GQ10_9EURY|nr:hypothetical protein [Haloterrigena gelatinilytica]NUB91430.1 hypothetical protein [Haloterrigena gelatinilytica]NUC72832.1 hypothetical protein [Haloterrigena gelatinilytica]